MSDIFNIAGRIHSTSQEQVVTTAGEILDETQNKKQSEVNADVARHESEIHGTGGINARLDDIEAAESITYDGGEAQIAQGSDFTNPDATKRAKIPTVGAILDGTDSVYDVSAKNPTAGPNSDGKFTLEYILTNADTLIPTSWRKGGMTIRFVDSSENKYIQCRLKTQSFSTNPTDWEQSDEPAKSALLSYSKEIVALPTNYQWTSLRIVNDFPPYASTSLQNKYDTFIRSTGDTVTQEKNTLFPYNGFIINATGTNNFQVYAYQLLKDPNKESISTKKFKVGLEMQITGTITRARIFLGNDDTYLSICESVSDTTIKWQGEFLGSAVTDRIPNYYFIWLRVFASADAVVKIGRFAVVEVGENDNINLPYNANRLDSVYKEELKQFFAQPSVLYTQQTLTSEQKSQALSNLGLNMDNYVPKSDIVDNLTTDDATKPLSAKQGKNLYDVEKEIMIDSSKEIVPLTSNYMWPRMTTVTGDPAYDTIQNKYDAFVKVSADVTAVSEINTIFPYTGNIAKLTFGTISSVAKNTDIYLLLTEGSLDSIAAKKYRVGLELEVTGKLTSVRAFLGGSSSIKILESVIQNETKKISADFLGSEVTARITGYPFIWLRFFSDTSNTVVKIGRLSVIEIGDNDNTIVPYPAIRLDSLYKEQLKDFFIDSNAVKFVEQSLTDEQKQQARENIGITHDIANTSPYTNKKFYSIGDSITYQNLWQPTLAALMMMDYQSAATRDANYPLGIGGAAICPVVTLRTTSQGDAYKAVDNLGNQLVDGNNNPLWFEVGKAPKQSIYYRADYFNSQYDDAEVIVMHAGQNDGNRHEAVDERRTFIDIGTVSDAPYTGLQYVLPQFAQVALYYPNVAIYDPDGTIAQDPTYSGCTFISARPTFCACLAGVIKKICSACPEGRFAINSIMRYKVNPGVEDDPTRIAVYNAMKSVCQIYDIPFVDLWNEMGYNYYNFEVYHKPNDGIHPNETGGRRMAAVIAQKL